MAKGYVRKRNGKLLPNNEQLRYLVNDLNINLGDIDTSEITNMMHLFKESERMDYRGIESWDTSRVTTMWGMFADNPHFNSDISNWNVENVKNMQNMFQNAKNFNQV